MVRAIDSHVSSVIIGAIEKGVGLSANGDKGLPRLPVRFINVDHQNDIECIADTGAQVVVGS